MAVFAASSSPADMLELCNDVQLYVAQGQFSGGHMKMIMIHPVISKFD